MNPKPDLGFRRAAVLLIAIGSLAMTIMAWSGPILGYDDANLMAEVVGRSPWDFFSGLFYYAYLPFYGLSYWADVTIAGGVVNAEWMHFVNALWHAAAGYAVFCVLVRLLEHRRAALLGALLFVLHPLHVESAAWIAGRKEVVSAFFFFVAWIFHLRGEDGGKRHVVGAVTCFLIATLAKAAAIVMPALLLVAVWLLPRYAGRRKVESWRTAPLWIAALVPLIVHIAVGVDAGVLQSSVGLSDRVLFWIVAWGDSIRRTLVPIGLSIEYADVRSAGWGDAALSGLWLAGAIAALFVTRRRAPFIAFGIAAFLVALSPFNNVFPATDVLAADRYLYLPLFGFAIAAAWLSTRSPRFGLAGGALTIVYLVLSVQGSTRFQSDEILWTRTLETQPDAAIAWLNRGIDRVERASKKVPADPQLRAEGVADLRKGVEFSKRVEVRAKGNLALVLPLLLNGEAGEALQHADVALELIQTDTTAARQFRADAYYQRGLVRKALGGFDVAAVDFATSARLVPSYLAAYEAGRSYARSGQPGKARVSLRAASSRDRAAVDPLIELARLERRVGDRRAEFAALQEATARNGTDSGVISAWVNFRLGGESPDWTKATEELERLPVEHPRRKQLFAAIESRRALYLFRRGELADAVIAANAARDGGLRDARILYELGEIYLATRRYETAAQCFLSASDVLDDTTRWRDAAARAYALKAYALASRDDMPAALRAWRAALDLKPLAIEAGVAPLRGEIIPLLRVKSPDLHLIAIAAVAGDPKMGRLASDRLFATQLSEDESITAWRVRALFRLFVTHDFEGATDDLAEVLKRREGDTWARYRMAQVQLRNGVGWVQTAEAIRSVPRREQGEKLIQDAVTILTSLIEDKPDFVLARVLRGEAWFSLGEQIRAKADYQRVRELDPRLKEVYLREAVLHRLVYVKGGSPENLDAGTRILEQSLQIDPNYFDALFELGNMHHLLYDRPDAGMTGRRAAFTQAIIAYRRAMAVNPRSREPREEWARICLKATTEAIAAGKLKPAHALLLQIAKDASDIPALYKERIRINLHPEFARAIGVSIREAFRGAYEAIVRLQELSPDDSELPLLVAMYERRLGASYLITWIKVSDKEQKTASKRLAIEAFQRAILAAPDDPENAAVRVRLRQLAPEFIKLDQEEAQVAYEAATAFFEDGKFKESVAGFRKAFLLFPESVELEYMLGIALARALDLDRAKEHLKSVATSEEASQFPAAFYELGQIYAVQKDKEVAIVWFERFLATKKANGDDGGPLADLARARLEELSGTRER